MSGRRLWAALECYVRDRFEVVFEEAGLVTFDLSVDDGLVPHPLVQLARLVQSRAVVSLRQHGYGRIRISTTVAA